MGFFDFLRQRKDPFPADVPRRRPLPVEASPTGVSASVIARDAERRERARAEGRERSIYLHSSRWDELLVADANGMPPLRLHEHNGRLWFKEDTSGKLVNIANQKLPSLGIWSVRVRGTSYRPDAVAATRIAIFEPVMLVREPANEFDRNAVAIHASGGHIGFFNKQMAARLAKRIDAGEPFEAIISSRGEPINVIAASPGIMGHLRRR